MTFCECKLVYCKNCGQTCTPEAYRRVAEDNEKWLGPYRDDWRSPCCHDELSEEPVSDRCDECGATADLIINQKFRKEWSMTLCPCCYDDVIRDKGHDMEYEVNKAEYMEDR